MVVTAPPLIAVVPAASVVRIARALVPPTAPPKVVVPPSFTVTLRAVAFSESSVLAKVTPSPLKVVFAFTVTASL